NQDSGGATHDAAPAQVQNALPWQHVVPEEELELYRMAGFGKPFQGDLRPALLVIDVQYRSVGHERLPIKESVEREYPTSCGEYGWRAVPHIARLIEAFRSQRLPVIFPHVAFK